MIAGRARARAALVMGLAAAWLLAFASASLAAPANDDFGDPEVLSGPLPIEVSRSNLGATKESGEFLGLFSPAGHSVWFEWEAGSDGWVTVGGCDADFEDVLGVYTGSAVNALTRVAGNDSEGPHCPFRQREYTFIASSGTKYEIAVDGDSFHLPEAPPPSTEGTFELVIEATPAPPNDSFASSTALVSPLEEEFEGEAFYLGSEFGYNWNAGVESGEPEHGSGPGGATVWYSWTAPASGEARISCCESKLRAAAYTGESLEALQPFLGEFGPGLTYFTAVRGTTYRIVVYGLDDESGEPAMGNFQLRVFLRAPVPPHGPEANTSPTPAPPDTTPPNTRIARRVLRSRPRIFVFRFRSTEPNSTFRCKLDRRPYRRCRSFKRFGQRFRRGRHTLKVFAVDAAGNRDPTPAVARFRISKKPKSRHRRAKAGHSGSGARR